LFSYPYEFEAWAPFFDTNNDLAEVCADLYREGEAILRKHNKDIAEFTEAAVSVMEIGGSIVPVLNCPYMWGSDACHKLCEENKHHPFTAYYWIGSEFVTFGMRSIEGGADVSKIAQLYGGGGHKHAAGFRVHLSRFSTALSTGKLLPQLTAF
jgi:hypothetical protein